MNAQEFAYWLQGFVELGGERPSAEQWEQIKAHLQLVFKKVTPVIDMESEAIKKLQKDYPDNWPMYVIDPGKHHIPVFTC